MRDKDITREYEDITPYSGDEENIEGADEEQGPEDQELKDTYAFALKLDPETGLPRVSAMGRGRIALEMAKRAREADITVQKDPEMAEKLFRPADDRVIPSRTYEIIANILTFIYRLNEEWTRENQEEPEEAGEEKGEYPDEGEQEETYEEYEEYEDEEETGFYEEDELEGYVEEEFFEEEL